mgnify:CR=1 FL=1|tara:strand:- start:4693 stop:7113 length:2421 start_codon:yes stop_codon:yes gene_type:complete
MAHANYSVSTYTSTETENDSVALGQIASSIILIITPDSGFSVSASAFSVGGATEGPANTFTGGNVSPEVASVTFTDTTVAGQGNNLVHAEVIFNNFIMPASNKDILVDIDGEAQPIVSDENISFCVTDNVQFDGYCPQTSWPASGDPIEPGVYYPTGANLCHGHFINTEEGSGITASQTTNPSWTSPLLNQTLDAEATAHSGTILSGVEKVVFTKSFWTPPLKAFQVEPFYILNAGSDASNYTIEETPSNFQVDKVMTQDTVNSDRIFCDTTDIIPGMQIQGSSINSCSLEMSNQSETCWPGNGWGFDDVRVIRVISANEIQITEKIPGLTTGDTLTFTTFINNTYTTPGGQTYGWAPWCCAKQFVVKYTGTEEVECGEHSIDFAAQDGDPAGAGWTDDVLGKITSIDINTNTISPRGETRKISVTGNEHAVFTIKITSNEGKTYDFTSDTFTTANTDSGELNLDNRNTYEKTIVYPSVSKDVTYTATVTPKLGMIINEGDNVVNTNTDVVSGVEKEYALTQYDNKTVTFTADATSSGMTLSSGLTAPGNIKRQANTVYSGGITIPTWTGTITHASGGVIYASRLPRRSSNNVAGDFTNSTSTDHIMNLSPSFNGTGKVTITATITGTLDKMGTANQTVTFDIDDFVSRTPNCYDYTMTYSISRLESNPAVAIKVHTGNQLYGSEYGTGGTVFEQGSTQLSAPNTTANGRDTDETYKDSAGTPRKVFTVVSTSLTHVTIGSNDPDYDDGYFFGHPSSTVTGSTHNDQIVLMYTGGATVGDTETFTYKCNDGTTDSATKTFTLTYTE